MHLRYIFAWEITPWIDNRITYISDPLNNEDPELHIKTYNAGGTYLPEQDLARKTSKRRKTQHILQETSTTHHTQQNNNSTTQNVRNPMQDLPHDYPNASNPQQHTKDRNALSIPYTTEITHPPPKPYNLRPQRIKKTPNIRKRNTLFAQLTIRTPTPARYNHTDPSHQKKQLGGASATSHQHGIPES